MHDMCHGNKKKNIVPSIHQLCRGEDIFAELFEDRTDQVLSRNTAEGNTKQLKTLYSRSEKTWLLGKHIDLKSMSEINYKNKTLITGRTILNHGKNALKTIRKACAVLKPLINDGGTPKHSGDSIDDVVNKMLDATSLKDPSSLKHQSRLMVVS